MNDTPEATVPFHQRCAHAVTLAMVQDLSSGKLKRDPNAAKIKSTQVEIKTTEKPKEIDEIDNAIFIHFLTGRKVKARRVLKNRIALEWIGGNKVSFVTDSELKTDFSRDK